ncbi:unnamed protein product, partial [Pylaiella littoralis]
MRTLTPLNPRPSSRVRQRHVRKVLLSHEEHAHAKLPFLSGAVAEQ